MFADPHPLARWFDRADGVLVTGGPGEPDPSVVAARWIAGNPAAFWIVAGDLTHNHPYNIARRVASIAALSRSGAGLLVEATAPGLHGHRPESDAVLQDGITILSQLWRTWPLDTIIADRAKRQFADVTRVMRLNPTGVFSVSGPLQIPVDQDELPFVLQRYNGKPAAQGADALVADPKEGESHSVVSLPAGFSSL